MSAVSGVVVAAAVVVSVTLHIRTSCLFLFVAHPYYCVGAIAQAIHILLVVVSMVTALSPQDPNSCPHMCGDVQGSD